jgi:YihY family inner membrane protein
MVRAIDRAQQRHSWLAMVVATWKKFSDDQAGNLAALVAYFSFASLFPLLLVAYTVLDLVAKGNAGLADSLTNALKDYPVVGSLPIGHGLSQTGPALVVGILLTLYASLGVANAIQNAMNTTWAVPRYQRPGFPKNKLRSLGLIAMIGPGEIITIALSTVAGGAGHLGGAGGQAAAFVVALLLNIGLFWLTFRLATSKDVRGRDLRLGAILAATAWQLLTFAVANSILHLHSNSAYGIFGSVLGILAWFYLQAQITLYVVELDVVRARKLWPRSLAPPPLTPADLRAYQTYAQQTQLRPEIDISVTEAVPAQRTASDKAAADTASSETAATDTAATDTARSDTARSATARSATASSATASSATAAADAAQRSPTDRPSPGAQQ